MTVSGYVRQLEALLPPGRLFAALGPNFRGLLEGIAEEFQLADDFLRGAYAETNPLTATHTLTEWEAKYQLPNDGTLDERRVRIQARRAARRRVRPEDYRQRFAGLLGLAASDVQIIETTSALAAYTGHARDVYRFAIFRDPFLPGHYVLADADALLDDYVQSHTLGRVIESTCFRCDDPFSLPDRDLLEAPELMTGRTIPYSEDAVFWIKGDDSGATFSSGTYTAIPNRGTQGGSVTAMSGGGAGPGPDLARVGGRAAPNFAAGECLQGTTATLQILHEPGTDCDLFALLDFSTAGVATTLLRDSVTGTQVGVHLERTAGNALTFAVFNGSAAVIFFSVAGVTTGLREARVKKRGLAFDLFLDGAPVATGTASSLTAGASSMTARIGAYSPTVNAFPGSIPEVALFGRALTDAEVARVDSYFAHAYRPGTPWALPALLWAESDRGATFDADGDFVSLRNLGHLGGTVTRAGVGPLRQRVAGKWAPLTTTNGGFVFGSESSLSAMHSPGTAATLTLLARFDAVPTSPARRIFGTRSTTVGARGVLVRHLTSDVLQLDVGNGATESLTVSGSVPVGPGWHVLQLTKNANSYTLSLDGAPHLSGVASGLVAGDAQRAASIGSAVDAVAPFIGAIPAFGVHPWAMTSQELEDVQRYLRRWTA